MKTRRFLAFVLVIAMVLGSVSVVFGASGTKKGTATTITLEKYTGSVTITNASGKEVKPREGAKLYSGYTIKTGKKSSANLLLDDKSALLIESSSKVQLNKSGKKIAVMLMSGTVLDVSEKLAKDQTLDIYTTNMVTGVRGTVPEVSHDSANDKSSSTTLQGTTEATEKTGGYTLKSTKLPAGYGASTTSEQVAVNRAENTGNKFSDVPPQLPQQDAFSAARKALEDLKTETLEFTTVNNGLQNNSEHQQGYEQAFFTGPQTPQDRESMVNMIMEMLQTQNQEDDKKEQQIQQAVQEETPATQGEQTTQVFEKVETLPESKTDTVKPVEQLPQPETQTPATQPSTGGGGSDSGSSMVKATIGLPTKVGDYNSPLTVYEGIRTASNLGDYDPIGLAGSTNDYMFYTSDASQFSVVFTDYLGLAGDVNFTLSQAGRTLPITSTSAGIFVSEASGSQRVWIATFNNPLNTGVITVDCTVTKSEGWTISVPEKDSGASQEGKDSLTIKVYEGSIPAEADLSKLKYLQGSSTDGAIIYNTFASTVSFVFMQDYTESPQWEIESVSFVFNNGAKTIQARPEYEDEQINTAFIAEATLTDLAQDVNLQCSPVVYLPRTNDTSVTDLINHPLIKNSTVYCYVEECGSLRELFTDANVTIDPYSIIEFEVWEVGKINNDKGYEILTERIKGQGDSVSVDLSIIPSVISPLYVTSVSNDESVTVKYVCDGWYESESSAIFNAEIPLSKGRYSLIPKYHIEEDTSLLVMSQLQKNGSVTTTEPSVSTINVYIPKTDSFNGTINLYEYGENGTPDIQLTTSSITTIQDESYWVYTTTPMMFTFEYVVTPVDDSITNSTKVKFIPVVGETAWNAHDTTCTDSGDGVLVFKANKPTGTMYQDFTVIVNINQ